MNEMLKTLNELCSFKSVAVHTGETAHPYGEEVNKALKYMLSLCDELGFRTKNLDNQLGYAEIGEGEELFGVLCHLDVVPVGKGWDYEPFAATLDGDRIYGRGVIDDKGPCVASVYAMKDILDSGKKLNKRIRLIFGQSEENGHWTDMDYYKKTEEIPSMGITPDGDFPAIYGEKGIYRCIMSIPKSETGFIEISGGQAANMVPDEARAKVEIGDEIIEFFEEGKAAHGSLPHMGENAISKLMRAVAEKTDGCFLANFYNEHIGFDLHGEHINLGVSDEQSGKLTLNVGKIDMDEEKVNLYIDIRYPVTFSLIDISKLLDEVVEPLGFTTFLENHQLPVYMDKDGDFIKKLIAVYREHTGRDDEPSVIGGGTYARAMSNIVAFGPMIPGRELTEHQKNEYILAEDFALLRDIYRDAFLRICAE